MQPEASDAHAGVERRVQGPGSRAGSKDQTLSGQFCPTTAISMNSHLISITCDSDYSAILYLRL